MSRAPFGKRVQPTAPTRFDSSRTPSRTLAKTLRTGRPLRKQRRKADQRVPRFAMPATLTDERPAVVELCEPTGDWEGDLIPGRRNRTATATLVDRRTRYVRLVALPDGHDADQVHARLTAALRDVPDTAHMTLTWNQGAEMACHDRLAPLFRDGVFVAHAGSPWQRGTNENTNGLLRQYLPKGSDLSVHTTDDLQAVEDASITASERHWDDRPQAIRRHPGAILTGVNRNHARLKAPGKRAFAPLKPLAAAPAGVTLHSPHQHHHPSRPLSSDLRLFTTKTA
ncbi:IS30 family transposase [Streptomyces sp. NPDC056534]|uniref:IS30 family transposase n=1 Tax=Streptomyces sp. NPDC056534 TaxID=3345857 RepID=UPI0036745ED5